MHHGKRAGERAVTYRRSRRMAFAVFAVLYGLIALFVLLPIGSLFYETLLAKSSAGWSSFAALVRHSGGLMQRTVAMGAATAALSTLFSLSIAAALFVAPEGIRRRAKALLSLVMISPPFVSALSYIQLFGRRGAITHGLLGLSVQPYGLWGIVFMQSVGFASLHALFLLAASERIDDAQIESALDLGASTDRVLRDVFLPNLRSAVVMVALLNFLKSIADFSTPAIIGGNYSVLAGESYLCMVAYGDMAKAAMYNIMIFLPSIPVFWMYLHLVRARNTATGTRRACIPFRGPILCVAAAIALAVVGMLVLQYASIAVEAFIERIRGSISWTFDHMRAAGIHVSGAMLRSVLYSLIAGAGGALIGSLTGYADRFRRFPLAREFRAVALLPYVLPGTFFGIAYIYAFRSPPLALTGTAAIVVCNMLFKQLPFSTQVGLEAAYGLDTASLDALEDLGAGRMRILADGVLVPTRRSIFVAFASGFAKSMTTVGSILFLVYPGKKVATIVLFDVIQSGKYHEGSAIAVMLMAVTGCMFAAIERMFLSRRGGLRKVEKGGVPWMG